MPLASMPKEVLHLILPRLDTLDDLSALSRTSSTFHNVCHAALSEALYPLFVGSYPFPHQLLLAAVKARQIADWANDSPELTRKLHEAIKEGREGLCDLAVSICPLTFEELRMARVWAREVLDKVQAIVLSDEVMTGFYSQLETNLKARNALLDIHIYTQLFHHAFDAQLAELLSEPQPYTGAPSKYLNPEFRDIRLDFLRYCAGTTENLRYVDSPYYLLVHEFYVLEQMLEKAVKKHVSVLRSEFNGRNGQLPGHIVNRGLDEAITCFETGYLPVAINHLPVHLVQAGQNDQNRHRIWLACELWLIRRGINTWENLPDFYTHPDRYYREMGGRPTNEPVELRNPSKRALSRRAYGYFKKPFQEICDEEEPWDKFIKPPVGSRPSTEFLDCSRVNAP
ncbi:MAG: hypothetical protein M1836_006786 [Candelina mexicana]|nr:MAG: hypothetical protein M1836_006786 [Candelina mexicana]